MSFLQHLRAPARQAFVAVLLVMALASAAAAKSSSVGGVIFTVDADHVQTVWPNARVTLKSLGTSAELSNISNDLGTYSFVGVLYGEYDVTVTLAGFDPVTKHVTIKSDDPAKLDFQLTLKGETQSVTVTADAPTVDLTSSSGGAPVLTAKILKSVIQLNQDFQDALPLLPGVVRGPDGLDPDQGRAHQPGEHTSKLRQRERSVYRASGAELARGGCAVGTGALESVLRGVRTLRQRCGRSQHSQRHRRVEVPVRRPGSALSLDRRQHSWRRERLAAPHLCRAAKKGQLYLFQSMGYGYDTLKTYSIPDPNNVRIVEKVNSYTQVDWNPSANQRFSAALALDPQDTFYANINTFNPQPVTADYHQRGYFVSATHRWILNDGGFLQSLFAAKQLDSKVYPADAQPGLMTLNPYSNSGSYFTTQQRYTNLYQWSQTLHWRPIEKAGRHLLTAGILLRLLRLQRRHNQSAGNRAAGRRHHQQPDSLRRRSGIRGDEE